MDGHPSTSTLPRQARKAYGEAEMLCRQLLQGREAAATWARMNRVAHDVFTGHWPLRASRPKSVASVALRMCPG